MHLMAYPGFPWKQVNEAKTRANHRKLDVLVAEGFVFLNTRIGIAGVILGRREIKPGGTVIFVREALILRRNHHAAPEHRFRLLIRSSFVEVHWSQYFIRMPEDKPQQYFRSIRRRVVRVFQGSISLKGDSYLISNTMDCFSLEGKAISAQLMGTAASACASRIILLHSRTKRALCREARDLASYQATEELFHPSGRFSVQSRLLSSVASLVHVPGNHSST